MMNSTFEDQNGVPLIRTDDGLWLHTAGKPYVVTDFHHLLGYCRRAPNIVNICTIGAVCYFENGLPHRDGDLPAVAWSDRNDHFKYWCQNGQLHRDNDQPAVVCEYNGNRMYEWYQHGQLHRLNGPAIVGPDNHQNWYLQGDEVAALFVYEPLDPAIVL